MTKYYTYKKDVPLKENEHLAFEPGRGYYAATGNPSPFPHPPVPKPTPPNKRQTLLTWARWAERNQAHYIYTQSALRREMYDRRPGDVSRPIHADCSQFYAALCHWSGIPGTTPYDWTGTLLQKGKHVTLPKPADCVVFGKAPGVHAAVLTEMDGGDWWTIGFGHSPGAPNRVTLSAMRAYFDRHGHPGVTYLAFTA